MTCGETNSRSNQNIIDALLLLPKRISQGFQLAFKPELLEDLKKSDHCLEVSPISNLLLGYVNDLRSHPIRFMMANGLQISLNSGHPGILGYHNVSLDYLAAFVAWDLGLKDLK